MVKGLYIKTRAVKGPKGKRVDEIKVIIMRLLYFLRDPTDANFDLLKYIKDIIGNNRISTSNIDKIFWYFYTNGQGLKRSESVLYK
jgi:hypothetical protein